MHAYMTPRVIGLPWESGVTIRRKHSCREGRSGIGEVSLSLHHDPFSVFTAKLRLSNHHIGSNLLHWDALGHHVFEGGIMSSQIWIICFIRFLDRLVEGPFKNGEFLLALPVFPSYPPKTPPDTWHLIHSWASPCQAGILSEKPLLEPKVLLVAPIAPGVPEAMYPSRTGAFWHRPGCLLSEGQSWEFAAKAVGSPEELNRLLPQVARPPHQLQSSGAHSTVICVFVCWSPENEIITNTCNKIDRMPHPELSFTKTVIPCGSLSSATNAKPLGLCIFTRSQETIVQMWGSQARERLWPCCLESSQCWPTLLPRLRPEAAGVLVWRRMFRAKTTRRVYCLARKQWLQSKWHATLQHVHQLSLGVSHCPSREPTARANCCPFLVSRCLPRPPPCAMQISRTDESNDPRSPSKSPAKMSHEWKLQLKHAKYSIYIYIYIYYIYIYLCSHI